jgi:Fur family ferric uptake transcriptional regulator
MMKRDTQQRRAIRRTIEDNGRPLSPREVLDSARGLCPGLGIATVYRTIKALAEEGSLAQVDLPGEPPRYEATGKVHHHHFHCRGCDRVYELVGCPDGLRGLTPSGFSLESHEVVLYGRCASCAA